MKYRQLLQQIQQLFNNKIESVQVNTIILKFEPHSKFVVRLFI